MNVKPTRLEVIITQKRSRFLATCKSFPDCKGLGDSRDDALSSLSRSIGRHVAKVATQAVDAVFSTDDFTQLISPVRLDSDEKVDKRLYNLDATLPVQMKPNPDVQHVPIMPMNEEDKWDEALNDVLQHMSPDGMLEDNDDGYSTTQSILKRPEDDGAFGILMSLN